MSEMENRGPTLITEGEWAGWRTWDHDAFETRTGPFYMREEGDSWVSAFRAGPQHMNGGGSMHGGCMLTFADFALFSIAYPELGNSFGVTINLSGDFLGPIAVGELVEARGEITRGGGKTIFVRGMITGDGKPALSFTGIIRKINRT
ncbi:MULTISPECIES: PaaI family thioesterase [Qipengyuania]|uniref:PaaI family thioesterase n=1 Tax=Qipengyuania soli TaxID=2782568 RepID=A0A7S8IVF9_9SPHN|nr:PaaI family thioesterase [Qipengyuania soli]QPC99827.1 PaaI family thioesterase [Qipengyuania soli]